MPNNRRHTATGTHRKIGKQRTCYNAKEAHHGGGQDEDDIVHQTRATIESLAHTLNSVGATLDDIVQLSYYIKNVADFRKGADTLIEYFNNGAPARMTVVTEFVGSNCFCQMDGIAYHKNPIN